MPVPNLNRARLLKNDGSGLLRAIKQAAGTSSNIRYFVYVDDFLLTHGYTHKQAIKLLCCGELTRSEPEDKTDDGIAFTMAMKMTEAVDVLHIRGYFDWRSGDILLSDTFHSRTLSE